jgi:hypothetical protein
VSSTPSGKAERQAASTQATPAGILTANRVGGRRRCSPVVVASDAEEASLLRDERRHRRTLVSQAVEPADRGFDEPGSTAA